MRMGEIADIPQIVRQSHQVSPISIHGVEIPTMPVLSAVREKGKARAVRRPHLTPVTRGVIGEAGKIVSIRIHHIDIRTFLTMTPRREGDVRAIR